MIIIIEQNSPMFSLKLDFRNFASIRETSNGAKKANRSRNTLKVSGLYVLPIKSGWSTIIQYWSKEVMCIVSIVSFVPRTATFFQEARLFGSPSPKISIGWKMTFLKSKLIDNRPSWPALNFAANVETRCSYRQDPCYVGDHWTHQEKKTGRGPACVAWRFCRPPLLLCAPNQNRHATRLVEDENRFLLLWEITVVCVSNLVLKGSYWNRELVSALKADGLVWCDSRRAVRVKVLKWNEESWMRRQ